MSAASSERLPTALRIVGSFLAALVLGSAPVASLSRPSDALLVLVFAFAYGLPALTLALCVQHARHHDIQGNLVRWCLAAPFLAAAATAGGAAAVALIVLPWNGELLSLLVGGVGPALIGLYFATIAAGVFFLWERQARRAI